MMWRLLFVSLIVVMNTQDLIPYGKTRQSSDYTHGVIYSADRARDGILTKCSTTNSLSNSWWNIDLLGLYEISNITIYNIQQKNIDIIGVQIRIGNSSETNGTANSRCTNITNFILNTSNTFECDNGTMLGRYVTFYSPEKVSIILCEVWFYGKKKDLGLMLIQENKTWEGALNHCRARNLQLANIVDKETQSWAELVAMNATSPFVWLGLHYTCTQDFWFWTGDHSFGYSHWAPGEEERGQCDMSVAMNTTDHLWYSKSDNEKFNFICTE